jgi:hypothetical protein
MNNYNDIQLILKLLGIRCKWSKSIYFKQKTGKYRKICRKDEQSR